MRNHYWPRDLAAFIESQRTRPFQYGQFDCMLFCADAIKSITGVDYAESLRGYTSIAEANAIIDRYGSKEALISAVLQRDPIHISAAMRGDVVLATLPTVDDGQSDCAGVCLGQFSAFPKDVGVRLIATATARMAWRIE